MESIHGNVILFSKHTKRVDVETIEHNIEVDLDRSKFRPRIFHWGMVRVRKSPYRQK